MTDPIRLQPKPPDHGRALRDLTHAYDECRLEIAQARTVAEAFTFYRYLAAMSVELMRLTDQAAARCEDLMREDGA